MVRSSLTYILGLSVKFFFQPIYADYANYAYFDKRSHLNFSSEIAEPNYTKPGRDGPWVGPFQNCVRQPRPPFKMAAVTKNRNFFNCPLLLYYKSK